MSKAFTRESDDEMPDRPALPPRPSLPPGVKNYMTRFGFGLFQQELERLEHLPAEEAARAELRIRQLHQILDSVTLVEKPADAEQVRFGATVEVRDQRGTDAKYRIVGIDEVDFDRDWISWQSPLARALMNRRVGEKVRFRAPAGEQLLEIRAISVEDPTV